MFLMLYKNFQSHFQENGICLFIVFVFKMLFLWKQSIAKPLLFMVLMFPTYARPHKFQVFIDIP
jgi:hypothetical protein